MDNGKKEITVTIECHDENNRKTGRLIFELGGIPEKEMQKLREEADKLGKTSHAFMFFLDQRNASCPKIVTHQMLFGNKIPEKTNYHTMPSKAVRGLEKHKVSKQGYGQNGCSR